MLSGFLTFDVAPAGYWVEASPLVLKNYLVQVLAIAIQNNHHRSSTIKVCCFTFHLFEDGFVPGWCPSSEPLTLKLRFINLDR